MRTLCSAYTVQCRLEESRKGEKVIQNVMQKMKGGQESEINLKAEGGNGEVRRRGETEARKR